MVEPLLSVALMMLQVQLLVLQQMMRQLQEQLRVHLLEQVQGHQGAALPSTSQPVASGLEHQLLPAAAAAVAAAGSAAAPSALTAGRTEQQTLWPGRVLEDQAGQH